MTAIRQHGADVIVIGGGVAGLSAALHLADRGRRVVLLERARPGDGATGVAAGMMGQLRCDATRTAMMMRSRDVLLELERRAARRVFEPIGSIHLASPRDRDGLDRMAAVAADAGLETKWWNPSMVRRRLPALGPPAREGLWVPTDGCVDPSALASLLRDAAVSAGVAVYSGAAVDRVETSRGAVTGCVVATRRFRAGAIVLAAGPWTPALASTVNLRLPVATLVHHHLTFEAADLSATGQLPTGRDRPHAAYFRPVGDDGLRVGRFGAEPRRQGVDALGPRESMRSMAAADDDPQVRHLRDAAGALFPCLANRPGRVQSGLMTFTPDGSALLGAVAHVAGLFLCTAFCGYGLMQACMAGRLIAQRIVGQATDFPLDPFDPHRFDRVAELSNAEALLAGCRRAYASYYTARPERAIAAGQGSAAKTSSSR